jgi:hypothetical protein
MTTATWRADVDLLAGWVLRDRRLLDRLAKHLHSDEVKILEAVIRSKGDPKTLAEGIGPVAIAKLMARGATIPERYREPAQRAWKIMRTPLKAAWRPPAKPTPQKLAQLFLDRYATKLAKLNTDAKAATNAVSTAAEGLRTVNAATDLAKLAKDLQTEVAELEALAKGCHHERGDAKQWCAHAHELLQESAKTYELVRNLANNMKAVAQQLEEVAARLNEWVEAPPVERAATAEAMAERMKAALDATASMHDEFLGLVFGDG